MRRLIIGCAFLISYIAVYKNGYEDGKDYGYEQGSAKAVHVEKMLQYEDIKRHYKIITDEYIKLADEYRARNGR